MTLGFSLLISSHRFLIPVLGLSEGAPLAVLWTVLKLEWASMHLVVGLTWNIERIMHLASLCFLSLNFDFVSDYQVCPLTFSFYFIYLCSLDFLRDLPSLSMWMLLLFRVGLAFLSCPLVGRFGTLLGLNSLDWIVNATISVWLALSSIEIYILFLLGFYQNSLHSMLLLVC